MDFRTDDQREIQALAREFADAEIQPYAAEWDREHRFPRELYGKLAELGLWAPACRRSTAAPARISSRTSSCSRSCRARTRALA